MHHCRPQTVANLLWVQNRFCPCCRAIHATNHSGPNATPHTMLCCIQGALDELLMAEEAFGMVTPSFLEGIDNLAMLLLDIVW